MILDKRSLGASLAFQVSGCDWSSCLAGNFSFSWQGRIYRCGEVCPSLGFWRQLCILKTKPTQKSRVFEVLQLLLWISSTNIWRYMKFVRGRAFWSWIFNREGSSTVQSRPAKSMGQWLVGTARPRLSLKTRCTEYGCVHLQCVKIRGPKHDSFPTEWCHFWRSWGVCISSFRRTRLQWSPEYLIVYKRNTLNLLQIQPNSYKSKKHWETIQHPASIHNKHSLISLNWDDS